MGVGGGGGGLRIVCMDKILRFTNTLIIIKDCPLFLYYCLIPCLFALLCCKIQPYFGLKITIRF